MIQAVSNATPTQPIAASTRTSTQSKTAPAATDSAQLSLVAQAALANLQETRETQAQTAKEAGHGDLQAQRLLAKEAAAKSVNK